MEAGRFEPIGSMWVEADCNIPSGESLVRQIVHGKRFFLDEFGRETTDLWLPDVFGYSAALPQILQPGGHHVVPDPEDVVERDRTGSRTARSGGRASTAPGRSRTSRPPTPTTAT